ncbi:MAG: 50S ribosomal protein L24 [Chloroflexi bacterium]|mgnify:CR=1 FL=1|jgi:large subunit ribosomal protein L24|nr:50S ribosomal protein L24 [Chloroflexota bacterium]MBT7081939.1 50S ribosomal protein L24 [Chloroflexota bacterium]MBT7290509.1 50S ribosomal protein L24 [Chloroflexota bacterium]
MKIRKNDNVIVTAGKDKGKTGTVRYTVPKKDRVVAEGINMIKKHSKPRTATDPGGIMHREAPIQTSNLMLVCSKCSKPTRIGYRTLKKGDKVRFCRKCNEVID